MRLDKYLKVSRLIKRRTVANEVADAGRIRLFFVACGSWDTMPCCRGKHHENEGFP